MRLLTGITGCRYDQAEVVFDPVAERKLRVKLDWYLMPLVSIVYRKPGEVPMFHIEIVF